jgi:hypothetical protein
LLGEHHADRRDGRRAQGPPAEDDLDERAAGAVVAVLERVNRLDLGVEDRDLHERRQGLLVDRRTQVDEEPVDVLGRWWHEGGAAGVVVVPPDPVLDGADLPGDRRVRRHPHQRLVDGHDALGIEAGHRCRFRRQRVHGVDVAEDLRSGGPRPATQIGTGLRTSEVASIDLEALDLRRGD